MMFPVTVMRRNKSAIGSLLTAKICGNVFAAYRPSGSLSLSATAANNGPEAQYGFHGLLLCM